MKDTPLSQLYNVKELWDELDDNIEFLGEYYTLHGSETFFQCQEIICLLQAIEREKNI